MSNDLALCKCFYSQCLSGMTDFAGFTQSSCEVHLPTGLAIVHPLFDRPSTANSKMLFTSVSHFENYVGFTDVLQLMLRLVHLLNLPVVTQCSHWC